MAQTSTQATPTDLRPDPQHFSSDMPARPVLADRQCTQRPETGKSGNAQRPKAQGKLPRAGTFNNRLPRTASANSGLPRGRSFQGARPQSTNTQAAQDGYQQRKAAKLYAEKRRAAGAAKFAEREATEANVGNRKEVEPSDVINITVDAKGVMIDTAKGSSHGIQGMGSRKNSRSRMTRSTSKSRNSFRRTDDKENMTNDSSNFKTVDADVDGFFTRKRSSDLSRRKKDSSTDNPGSWDGSMPRRHSSRSFIERGPKARNTDKPEAENQTGAGASAVPRNNTETTVGERPRRQRSQKLANEKTGIEGVIQTAAEEQQNAVSNPTTREHTESHDANPDTTPIKGITQKSEKHAKGSGSPTISDVSESGTDGDAKESSPEKIEQVVSLGDRVLGHAAVDNVASSTPVKTVSCLEKSGHPENCSGTHSKKALSNGKWCDECAGLGLHIAALLSELDKRRSSSESSSEGSTSSSEPKKTWKSMVTQTMLGDSKGKISSEKARLQQEINVLKATVDFLYKKVELMEMGTSPSAPSVA